MGFSIFLGVLYDSRFYSGCGGGVIWSMCGSLCDRVRKQICSKADTVLLSGIESSMIKKEVKTGECLAAFIRSKNLN